MKPRDAFQRRARQAIADPLLQIALDNNATRRRDTWQPAFDTLPNSTDTRSRARAIRKDVVRHLDQYL
ncbi:MAG: amino acid dehydrogenase, partial [Chloroflexi bacterium]|nr:amino acid dehydrogenase [Chloroflexota bacterium]